MSKHADLSIDTLKDAINYMDNIAKDTRLPLERAPQLLRIIFPPDIYNLCTEEERSSVKSLSQAHALMCEKAKLLGLQDD